MTGSSGLSNRKRSRGSYKQQRPTSSSIYNNQNQYRIEDEGGIEMEDIGQTEKYKKQGLGGYEDEESLDNSGRID